MNIYHKNWDVLEDGGSGRWVYSRKVSNGVYLFICIGDMVDACGKEAEYWFHAEVSVVNLNIIGDQGVENALESAGIYLPDYPESKWDLISAELCHSYGSKGVLWGNSSASIDKTNKDWQWNCPSEGSKVFRGLRASARRFAEANLVDDTNRDSLLDSTIVNAIGQSARSYMGGTEELWDQLRFIKGDPNATAAQKLVLGMYQKCEHTLGAGPIPKDIKE